MNIAEDNIYTLKGDLSPVQTISISLKPIQRLSGIFEIPKESDIPAYEGEYTVTPTQEAVTLNTKNLKMLDDVIVLKIPYYEVTNLSGGYTVYIGGN